MKTVKIILGVLSLAVVCISLSAQPPAPTEVVPTLWLTRTTHRQLLETLQAGRVEESPAGYDMVRVDFDPHVYGSLRNMVQWTDNDLIERRAGQRNAKQAGQ